MFDHVVVDVEIQKTIEETLGGWNATDKLGVAVACVWEYHMQRMRVYGPEDVEALRQRLLDADRISGFNIFNFDFPVIWGLSKQEWLALPSICLEMPGTVPSLKSTLAKKTDDMLRRIWLAKKLDPDRFSPNTHGGVGLDVVAWSTLGVGKIGHGADAPKWYQQGLIQKVANYCADDVALERDLTNFVEQFGYVIADGEIINIPMWKGKA